MRCGKPTAFFCPDMSGDGHLCAEHATCPPGHAMRLMPSIAGTCDEELTPAVEAFELAAQLEELQGAAQCVPAAEHERVRAEGRAYPLPMPADANDARFTIGLMLEVAAELERRGYPKLTGLDFVELQQSLFRFLYKVAP